jgi:hypothetical protein
MLFKNDGVQTHLLDAWRSGPMAKQIPSTKHQHQGRRAGFDVLVGAVDISYVKMHHWPKLGLLLSRTLPWFSLVGRTCRVMNS